MPIGGNDYNQVTFYRNQMEDAGARILFLETELTAIRDLASRGTGSPTEALQAIEKRASHALADDDPENSLQRRSL